MNKTIRCLMVSLGLLLAAGSVLPAGAADPELVFSTFLGGSDSDWGRGIAVDGAGHVWVVGTTSPGTSGAFLMRFDTTGALVSSTLLGDLFLRPFDLAVDPGGTIHLAGTASPDGGARLVRIDPAITRILDVVTLAGTESGQDAALGVAADARGTSYLTGITGSSDFPTRNPVQPALAGREDAFVAAIAASTSNSVPDCGAAVASPGSLWPPNGKLRPIAIGCAGPDGLRRWRGARRLIRRTLKLAGGSALRVGRAPSPPPLCSFTHRLASRAGRPAQCASGARKPQTRREAETQSTGSRPRSPGCRKAQRASSCFRDDFSDSLSASFSSHPL